MLQGIAAGMAGRSRILRVAPLLGMIGLLAACASDPTAHRGVRSGAVRYAPPVGTVGRRRNACATRYTLRRNPASAGAAAAPQALRLRPCGQTRKRGALSCP